MQLLTAWRLYRFSCARSLGLIALTIFALTITWLAWHEFQAGAENLPRFAA